MKKTFLFTAFLGAALFMGVASAMAQSSTAPATGAPGKQKTAARHTATLRPVSQVQVAQKTRMLSTEEVKAALADKQAQPAPQPAVQRPAVQQAVPRKATTPGK